MADPMVNREGREALRGAEEETVDLIVQVLTSDQWAELLKAPLERAVTEGNRGLAQKLVGAGAEIGDALHDAARYGYEAIVNDLLENGVSVTVKDTGGYTPLHYAAQDGTTEMVQLLLLKGADKEASHENGYTPLYLAALFGRVAAALALMAAGADVSLRCGGSKRSVVHVAAQGVHVDIMRAAIERGADVDAVNTDQDTPLHAAVSSNKFEVIDLLLEAGANIEARNGGRSTPLHAAAGQACVETVLALLKHGAHANAQDNDQNTPLHWAAGTAGTQGAADVVDSLLRSGADETMLDDLGQAPADVVAEDVDEEDQLAEDVERVRHLLAHAPADRAWRRRGYLVLCRAHPDRIRQVHDISRAHAGMARITRGGTKLGRTEASVGSGTVKASQMDEQGSGDWAVARALGLQEEGLFRTIVGYL